MTAGEITIIAWFVVICLLIALSYVRVVASGMQLLRQLGYPRWPAVVPPVVWIVSLWTWVAERRSASGR